MNFKNKNNSIIKRSIYVPGPFDCNTFDITCKNGSGYISIEKDDTETPTPDAIMVFKSNTLDNAITTVENPVFSGGVEQIEVPEGDYEVYGSYEKDNISYYVKLNEKLLQVSNKPFSVSAIGYPATEMGGKGKVKITANNVTSNILWNKIFNTWSPEVGKLNIESEIGNQDKGSYEIMATHNGCNETIKYTIESPTIKIEEAEITYRVDESSNALSSGKLDIISSGDGNIDDYTFYLIEGKGDLTDITVIKSDALCQINKSGEGSFVPVSGK